MGVAPLNLLRLFSLTLSLPLCSFLACDTRWLSEDLSLAFTIACISRGTTSERCQPRELSSVKGGSWMRMWSRGSRVTWGADGQRKQMSVVGLLDWRHSKRAVPSCMAFLFHWGFVCFFCSRCLLITFQFKSFWEEFCMVPANLGQDKLSLEDEVWFSMHVCITIGFCGVGWIFIFLDPLGRTFSRC